VAKHISAFVAGLLFALGLGVAGMTHPSKVLGFLDLFGDWDPQLVFVMGGAVAVYLIGFRLVRHRPHPVFESTFALPTRRDIDRPLVVGAVLFGVGWGLAGLCPGPALVGIASGAGAVLAFVVAMVGGMYLRVAAAKLGQARDARAQRAVSAGQGPVSSAS
jgi:hypothetical protein